MGKDEIRVSEIFDSIQGEGNTMGKPSVFLRLQGCNLMCGGQGTEKDKELHDGAKWRCDTIEVWLKGKTWTTQDLANHLIETYHNEFRSGFQLVITGGEPMLQQKQLPALIKEIRNSFTYELRVEVETNGTVAPSDEMIIHVNQFNVSPKLSNSGMPRKRRINEDALRKLNYNSGDAIFKFVITEMGDINEMVRDYIHPFNLKTEQVWLMPGCSTRGQFEKTAPMVAEMCKYYGFHFSSRLQINLWNEVTGV